MKIELTLPALERLIGGDTEIEVSLRKQIVQEFARRHLKEVVESETYTAALSEAKEYCNRAVSKGLGVDNMVTSHLWPTVTARFRSLVDGLIKENATKIVEEALNKFVHYWKRDFIRMTRPLIDDALKRHIEQEISEGIRSRLEAAKSL